MQNNFFTQTNLILASASTLRQSVLDMLGIAYTKHVCPIDEHVFDHLSAKKRVALLSCAKARACWNSFCKEHFNGANNLRAQNVGAQNGANANAKNCASCQDINYRVLGADTLIVYKKQTLGKPQNRQEAFNFLQMLSGKSHQVITAISVFCPSANIMQTKTNITRVKFKKLTTNQINAYLDTNEYIGAAGAYRIQGKGSCLVKCIKGSFFGVAGLPTSELYEILGAQTER